LGKYKDAERNTRLYSSGGICARFERDNTGGWENGKSFDESWRGVFPHEAGKRITYPPPQARIELKEVGWTKGLELAKAARRDGLRLCNRVAQSPRDAEGEFRQELERGTDQEGESGCYRV
jgi:hypothetical protein